MLNTTTQTNDTGIHRQLHFFKQNMSFLILNITLYHFLDLLRSWFGQTCCFDNDGSPLEMLLSLRDIVFIHTANV